MTLSYNEESNNTEAKMVLSNSTPNNQKQNEFKVDTAHMNSADLSELLQLDAEIEERRQHRYSIAGDGSGLLKARMTREELFEISSLDDDRFLTALEHQNSYTVPSRVQVTDLDLSSIENLMKYFDEDVPVTPTKMTNTTLPCQGKVANAIATFKSKAEQPATQKTSPAKPLNSAIKISELKQKYEMKVEPEPLASLAATITPSRVTKPARLPMKVKEMAQLFNSKISQVMRRTSEGQQYAPLQNEDSPEAKLPPKRPPQPAPRYKPVSYRLPGLPSPVPSPRQRRKGNSIVAHSPCLVAEDVFRELSVKDKALLFNKFVGEMSAKHPKFNAHAEGIKEQVKKQIARGEVVTEHQASVKQITQELEAKCVLNTTTSPPRSLPGHKSVVSPSSPVSPKSSENLHISTLTVVLKPSPKRRSPSKSKRCDLSVESITQTHKRNISSIRSVLPTEAYAPPKKIRRTRNERLSGDSKLFFPNEQLESLFYNWLREENGVLFDITSACNSEQTIEITLEDEEEESSQVKDNTADVTQKSAVERLLEEAIAKLEESRNKELMSFEEKDIDTVAGNEMLDSGTPSSPLIDTPSTVTPSECTPRKAKRRAPPIPKPRTSLQTQSSSISSSSASVSSSYKPSDAEESESGLSTLPKITSDDSQPENQQNQETLSKDFEFVKPLRPPRKKKMRRTLTWKKENSIVEATAAVTSTDSDSDYKKTSAHHIKKKAPSPPTTEQSYIELDKSLMRHVNSPRKIKSAYTLTVMSSPSPPNAGSDHEQSQTPRPSLNQSLKIEPRALADSFIDQGFETGSNEPDQSPMRRSSTRQLENASPAENCSPRNTLDNTKPSCFSTPVKGHGLRGSGHAGSMAQQQLFSPIPQSAKQQREPRRSSLAMQVIREDHPLETHLDTTNSAPITPCSFSASESAFFANAPTADMPSNLDDLTTSKPVSMFWIAAGDFTVSLEIFHNAPERLRLLYEIFTQKSCETRDLAFGIDGHKFTLQKDPSDPQSLPPRPPGVKGCSHYWFASGDLAVPFSGKLMTDEKIQRLFQFLKTELTTSGNEQELRFGVDHIEFSSVPEFWLNTPKFSIESSYSMLVGLQTGNSNGLEGRSKYAWPNNNSNAIKTSDLDHSEFESDSFSNSGRLSFSPEMFSMDYENVPLDELFEKASPRKLSSTDSSKQTSICMPQMLETLQQQKLKLKNVEQRIRSYAKPTNLTDGSLSHSRESPEYIHKLRAIIRAIDSIGLNNGFRTCSMEQLESFMYFLSEYADVCLTNCSEHMDKILDTLLDRRAVAV
ncbi:uncharacterized protein LOC115625718 [Scaptodrosophila lebanonensis]|uniref:Uncharacterized protein LOC115625718 n=1 Tax=Drosophila lebanonensis TaxID=7225 RepID=A0A6J2TL16_DROLE|nr:uncharacterized protein LOC115625718 [Scaptodrosophila lebanonensis]